MDNEQIIASLTRDLRPVARGALWRRLYGYAATGWVGSALLFLLLLGPQPHLGEEFATLAPYLKLALSLAFGFAGWRLVRVSAIPGRPVAAPLIGAAAIAVLAAVAAIGWWVVDAQGRTSALVLGSSWSTCSPSILLLSIPLLAALLAAMRRFAPTRLRLAGFAAGLCAGGAAAAIYALYCSEYSPAFIAIWYSLGILAASVVGAVIGPRALRW